MRKLTTFLFCLFPFYLYAYDYKNVALVSVSSTYDKRSISYIDKALENKGYKVTNKYLSQIPSDLGYVNVKPVRAKNLINAMLDNNVDIIWFVRGGSGALNILNILKKNLDELKKSKPKLIVGFSDVTAIHDFVNKYLGWKSIHGVVAEFNKDVYSLESNSNKQNLLDHFIAFLFHEKKENNKINSLEPLPDIGKIIKNGTDYKSLIPLVKKADVKGVMIGGNMTLIDSIIETPYQPDFKGKILVLEDTHESYRQLDRNLNHFLMMDSIKSVNAIVFGQFYPIDADDADRLIYKIAIVNFAKQFSKPVFY